MKRKELEDKELKNIELEILKHIRNVCEEYGLRYYLAYGTLLGAVRHKGFFPWDDDIDIWMPREDYEKFLQIQHDSKGKYQVFSTRNRKDYYYEFAKVVDTDTTLEEIGFRPIKDYGVYVDVFPLDGVPCKLDRFLLKYMFILKTATINIHPELNLTHKELAKLFRCIGKLGECLGAFHYPKQIDKIARKYSLASSDFMGYSLDKQMMHKSYFEQSVKIEFEHDFFDAPIGYHECLTRIYGATYMELPPIEMRHSVHNFIATLKE